MIKPLPFIIQGKNIVVLCDGKSHTITETNIGYTALKEAIKSGDWDSVPNLLTPEIAITHYVKGGFELVDGILYDEGVKINNSISDRMYNMFEEGFPVEPLLKFYKNIKDNPSTSSAEELYGFLEKNSLPITEDGCFLAYKRVNDNYTDCHTGTIDNSIGKTVTMERKSVNDNRNETCSTGLHFCSHSYLGHFSGDRVVIVKINPVDVVSIPTDYDNAKGRCCKYVVIGEMSNEEASSDSLSETPVYVEKKVVVPVVKASAKKKVVVPVVKSSAKKTTKKPDTYTTLRALGLRQQAKIFNLLSGGNLKKFSYNADVDRRLYDKYKLPDILAAAKKLGLV